ncbi:unnamed protein product [Durusdinium trenchii]|uniref:Ketosynthase family 3 (KS3) domain-containing protein n=1 Tax=Durusdinium trenchii TaxID=1381693 RepID=A0ABP0QW09_9DINO
MAIVQPEPLLPPVITEEFSSAVVHDLIQHGFCKLRVPELEQPALVVETAHQLTAATLPHLELEEGVLGRRSKSKAYFLDRFVEEAPEPLAGCIRRMTQLAEAVGPGFSREVGFQPLLGLQQLLLREPLQRGERRLLSPGPLTEEEVEQGYVEQYLTFLQSRRLCFLYIVQAAAENYVELFQQGSKTPTKVVLGKDSLVIFRHDQFSYSYQGSGVALQGWLVALRDRFDLEGLEGDYRGMEEVYGTPMIQGQAVPAGEQVNIMSIAPMLPGRVNNLKAHHLMFSAQTDTFLELPALRFDVATYYTDDPEGDPNASSKAYTKHAGVFPDDEILGFDARFFGIPEKQAHLWPPCLRLCLEKCYEAAQLQGYSRETLQGQNMALYNADIGNEFDPFMGIETDPDNWAQGRLLSLPSSGILSYHLGLKGPSLSIDTACSSSLVASNLLYNYLRKRPDPTLKEAICSGMLNCLSAGSFVGLSQAGMLGRTGRCKSFDNSANGYARGEAVIGSVWKVGEEAQDVENRQANFVSGFVNQDGRSASLTAPNGPSQQLCIRTSHRLAQILPAEIWTTENHGTGTALGDPIEVGSVRACFSRGREVPLVVTTGKSHQGHSEATAGLSGITKVVNTLRASVAPSQNHLKFLNAHIDDAGFVAHFPIECCELYVGEKGALGGLNSFGFGGTNSRGEIWAMSRDVQRRRAQQALGRQRQAEAQGAKAIAAVTVPCASCGEPMCFRCGMAMSEQVKNHRCGDIREEVGSYDVCSNCYQGSFHYQSLVDS